MTVVGKLAWFSWRRDSSNYPSECMTTFLSLLALNLSDRTSITALDTKIKIQMQLGEFEEALKLVNEWRMIEPEVRQIFDSLLRGSQWGSGVYG